MADGFILSPDDRNWLRRMLAWYKNQVMRLASAPAPQILPSPPRYGKLDEDLDSGSYATVSRYTWDSDTSDYTDSNEDDTVYAPPTMTAGSIVSGTWVRYEWRGESQRWLLVEPQWLPADIVFGVLDGALAAGGSATLSIYNLASGYTDWVGHSSDSGDNETVYAPAWLRTGSIASGKWVQAELDGDGNYRVTHWELTTVDSAMTSWQFNATSEDIEKKSQKLYVPLADTESSWTKLDDTYMCS